MSALASDQVAPPRYGRTRARGVGRRGRSGTGSGGGSGFGDGSITFVGERGPRASDAPAPPSLSLMRMPRSPRPTLSKDQQSVSSLSSTHACGNVSRKRVPRPGVDCTSTSPSCSCTIRYTMDNPIPLPFSFVVKYRSKIRPSSPEDPDAGVFDVDLAPGAAAPAARDPQRSAVGHRLTRIQREVQERLRQHVGSAVNLGHALRCIPLSA